MDSDKEVDNVRDPDCDHGADIAADGEGGGDFGEEDVGEAEGEADADVEAHSALDLPRGKRGADDGEDEEGEGGGNALVILDLEKLGVAQLAFLLSADVGGKLRHGHRLAVALGDEEVGGHEGKRRVLAFAGGDVLAHA